MLPYFDAYLVALRARVKPKPLSPSTLTVYRTQLARFGAWLAGRPVTADTLNAYRVHLQQGHRPRSVHQAWTAIASYREWLEESDLPGFCDPHELYLPDLDEPLREVPTDAEVAALFAAAEGLPTFTREERLSRARSLAVLTLAADCVLRRCEICALELADLNLSDTPPQVHVRTGKGAAARWIPLNERAVWLLRSYLSVREEWAKGAPARLLNGALFALRGSSGRMDDRHCDGIRRRLLHAAGLEGRKLHLHGLRHWGISRMLGVNGVNWRDVQKITGHRKAETLLGYCHAALPRMILAVAGTLPERKGAVEVGAPADAGLWRQLV